MWFIWPKRWSYTCKNYQSHIVSSDGLGGSTVVKSKYISIDWEQLKTGKIQKSITVEESDFEEDIEDFIREEDPFYIVDNDCYALVSLDTVWEEYFERLYGSIQILFGNTYEEIKKIGDDFELYFGVKEVYQSESKRLLSIYYRETVERLKKYDAFLLLLFLSTELNTLYQDDNIANYETNYSNETLYQEIEKVKALLEAKWLEKNEFSL